MYFFHGLLGEPQRGQEEKQGEGGAPAVFIDKFQRRERCLQVQPFCGAWMEAGAGGSGGKVWPGVSRRWLLGLAVPPGGIGLAARDSGMVSDRADGGPDFSFETVLKMQINY